MTRMNIAECIECESILLRFAQFLSDEGLRKRFFRRCVKIFFECRFCVNRQQIKQDARTKIPSIARRCETKRFEMTGKKSLFHAGFLNSRFSGAQIA